MDLINQSNRIIRGIKEPIYAVDCDNITFQDCLSIVAVSSTHIWVLYCNSLNPGRNFVQFDKVIQGGISHNKIVNTKGLIEDSISIYQSKQIYVGDNYIRGGGKSNSGSGIMLGDMGGSDITCVNNELINTGNCGIGIAGGDHINVMYNKVFSQQTPISNVGIYAWAQGIGCSDILISSNRVNWTNKLGNNNGFWNEGNIQNLIEENNLWNDQTLSNKI